MNNLIEFSFTISGDKKFNHLKLLLEDSQSYGILDRYNYQVLDTGVVKITMVSDREFYNNVIKALNLFDKPTTTNYNSDTNYRKMLFIREIGDKSRVAVVNTTKEFEDHTAYSNLEECEFKWTEVDMTDFNIFYFNGPDVNNFRAHMTEIFKSTDGWKPIITHKLWEE